VVFALPLRRHHNSHFFPPHIAIQLRDEPGGRKRFATSFGHRRPLVSLFACRCNETLTFTLAHAPVIIKTSSKFTGNAKRRVVKIASPTRWHGRNLLCDVALR